MSYGWFKAVIPVVSGLAIQRDGQSVDIRYPPGTPTFGATYITPVNFDSVHWLRPERPAGAPVWHYWVSRLTPNLGSPVDLSTVDPMLRSMVAYAQSKGILTLPSCEGHFFNEAGFEAQYQWLLAEVPKLRAGTLRLWDVETCKLYQPQIPNWMPPEKNALRNLIRCFNGIGRIGFSFADPAQADYFVRLLDWVSEAYAEKRGDRTVVSVIVRGASSEELAQRWQGVETALRRAT